jgi:hypothetical protein
MRGFAWPHLLYPHPFGPPSISITRRSSSARSLFSLFCSHAQFSPHNNIITTGLKAAMQMLSWKTRCGAYADLCAASVQAPFERGIALLHSFWYEEALKQFQSVAAADPHCAMGHRYDPVASILGWHA